VQTTHYLKDRVWKIDVETRWLIDPPGNTSLRITLDNNSPGHSNNRRVGRHVARYDRPGTDNCTLTDCDGAENLGPHGDGHPVSQRWVALCASHRRDVCRVIDPKGHTLIESDVVANLCRLADDHTHSVVNEEATTDRRPRVDFDPGKEAGDVRNHSRNDRDTAAMEPMGKTVCPDGVQAWRRQNDFEPGSRSRVAIPNGLHVFPQLFKEFRHASQHRSVPFEAWLRGPTLAAITVPNCTASSRA